MKLASCQYETETIRTSPGILRIMNGQLLKWSHLDGPVRADAKRHGPDPTRITGRQRYRMMHQVIRIYPCSVQYGRDVEPVVNLPIHNVTLGIVHQARCHSKKKDPNPPYAAALLPKTHLCIINVCCWCSFTIIIPVEFIVPPSIGFRITSLRPVSFGWLNLVSGSDSIQCSVGRRLRGYNTKYEAHQGNLP